MTSTRLPASFRDPSGFLFTHDGLVHRHVSEGYRSHYDRARDSGLFAALATDGLLIPHREVELAGVAEAAGAYRILLPEQVPFVSYPHEWCFSQLKDAALLTLEIQRRALDFGMSLKDATAFNVQFRAGRPVFIDSLSFEAYEEGRPWIAYRQFCQHFLAPLALMAHVHVDLGRLLRGYVDGIPLDVASRLLPVRTRLSFGLLSHIHLHARAQLRHADGAASAAKARESRVSKTGLLGLVDGLKSAVQKLEWMPQGTTWGDYYADTNYTDRSHEHKQQLVAEFLKEIAPARVWDLGANTGLFSRIASEQGIETVSFDMDPAAIEKSYREMRQAGETRLLPLVMDLANPSPAMGWAHEERASLEERGPADAVMALALVHHLAIGNNVPLDRIADLFHRLGRELILEFVPKTDSQVERLLATREDIFPDYARETVEAVFGRYFRVVRSEAIRDSQRILYRMASRTLA